MRPEREIIVDLLDAAERSSAGLDFTLTELPIFPANEQAFEEMDGRTRMVATAMLKQVEQLEGSLNGLFRVILKSLGIALKGLYPFDIGAYAEEMGFIPSGQAWVDIVKLRNELVHEYPFDLQSRFDRSQRAYASISMLREATALARVFVTERGWLGA